MIYNLKQYIKNNRPAYSYAVNGFHNTTASKAVSINNTTSIPAPWIDRSDYTVQIFSRAESPLDAEKQAQDIFSIVDRFFDVILPETTVTYSDGSTEVLPEIKAYQITPLQRPYWFGYDQNENALYVFNIKVITR